MNSDHVTQRANSSPRSARETKAEEEKLGKTFEVRIQEDCINLGSMGEQDSIASERNRITRSGSVNAYIVTALVITQPYIS
jgi:hypothetical protein